jgi:hypothetical protein
MDKNFKDKAKKLAELFTAISNEKTIQVSLGEKWADLDLNYDPIKLRYFVLYPDNYRIKPEPRKIWVNGDPDDPYCDWTTDEEHALNWEKDGINVIEFVEKS